MRRQALPCQTDQVQRSVVHRWAGRLFLSVVAVDLQTVAGIFSRRHQMFKSN